MLVFAAHLSFPSLPIHWQLQVTLRWTGVPKIKSFPTFNANWRLGRGKKPKLVTLLRKRMYPKLRNYHSAWLSCFLSCYMLRHKDVGSVGGGELGDQGKGNFRDCKKLKATRKEMMGEKGNRIKVFRKSSEACSRNRIAFVQKHDLSPRDCLIRSATAS